MVSQIAGAIAHFNLDITEADVPSALRHGNKILPLGRYLRRLIRTELGMDPNASKEALLERSKEMLVMLCDEKGHFTYDGQARFKAEALAQGEKVASRSRIFKKRGQL